MFEINRRWGSLLAIGGLFLLGSCSQCVEPAVSADPPNIILISLESIRPDHVGCYGAVNSTTPALDALAAEAVVYTDAHSVTSWTLTAHASLLTGLYPSAHEGQERRNGGAGP